jgi:hypothetical protein
VITAAKKPQRTSRNKICLEEKNDKGVAKVSGDDMIIPSQADLQKTKEREREEKSERLRTKHFHNQVFLYYILSSFFFLA